MGTGEQGDIAPMTSRLPMKCVLVERSFVKAGDILSSRDEPGEMRPRLEEFRNCVEGNSPKKVGAFVALIRWILSEKQYIWFGNKH